jgi:fatty acid synthase subunit alpha
MFPMRIYMPLLHHTAQKSARSSFLPTRSLSCLEQHNVSDVPPRPVAAGNASIHTIFGGEGANKVYFNELQFLYDTYKPFVRLFVTIITDNVVARLAAACQGTLLYSHGLNVSAWLDGSIACPPTAYLVSVPVSSPLIGLTQLVQYLIVCRMTNPTPGDLRDRIAGATGHSQSLVSAVAIAASATFESFTDNACKAVRWLFLSGLRVQEAFPVTSLEPGIVWDTVDGGEGVPSPMLSIAGLPLKDVESQVKKTNSHLPENSQLTLSLCNWPRVFVVTGPTRSLYGLVINVKKIRASSGLDQNKIPFFATQTCIFRPLFGRQRPSSQQVSGCRDRQALQRGSEWGRPPEAR